MQAGQKLRLLQQRNKNYTVTFDSAGGSAVTTQTIEEGQKATKPAAPTKSDDTTKLRMMFRIRRPATTV
ncbi:MAG: InlB B-repeat-containing protein [Roseburia intestinalis]